MTKFKISKENFKKFLQITACEGVVKFRDSKALRQPLFSSFYLTVKDGTLEVLTVDTIKKKIQLNTVINGVDVIEEGTIAISDYNAILDVLKGKGLGKNPIVTVFDEGSKLKIETDDDGYEIRQRDNEDLEKVSQKLKYLRAWRKGHVKGEGGILVASAMNPKTKEIVKVPFSMKIVVNKDDLLKVVDDTINLTKDNKTRLTHLNGLLKAFKGEENARTKGRHKIPYEDIGKDLIDFEEYFYNIQTIVPNLFSKIILNIRRIESDGSLAVFIESVDEKSKTKINVGLISIKG